MTLPKYRQDLTLEDALSQFDYATSQLVLHPFNGAGEDINQRRQHVSDASRDTYLAASRWYGILEKDHKKLGRDFPPELAQRYLGDISESCNVMKYKIIPWYSRLVEKETSKLDQMEISKKEYAEQKRNIGLIAREKALIENYISLLGVIKSFVIEMTNSKDQS